MSAAVCPLCAQRKGRRACPAKGASICSACCGSKRRVEIDCPPDCVWLDGAHAGSWQGRETERRRDTRRLAPHLQRLSPAQADLFFLALVGLASLRGRRRELDDALLADALGALRKTVETRQRGILYDHQADDLRAQGLVLELRGLFEARDAEGRPVSPDDRDLAAVLAALEGALADVLREKAGATAFLDTARRLVGAPAAAASPEPRLLVEP
ncbi:MAG: hypothetical protein DMF78_07875 [Acidobacteria bacterium]|nr:MAG: hypothetical protein DMF78_07875 [Acidobacteriota bacterium]